jgi:hypothetical protein
MKKPGGAVLIFSLMILSIIIILTEQLISSVMVGSSFTQAMIHKEHSKILALGGLNLAIAQLTFEKDTEKKTEAPEKTGTDKDKATPLQKFVFKLISNLNRLQTFDLDSKIDGVSGQLKICISSEHGKININEAFDFKKQEFKKAYQFLLAGLEIPGKIPAGEFIKRITEFLKKRNKKLYDVSELIGVQGFEQLDAFYNPPKLNAKGNGIPNDDLALQDIFTIWTDEENIDPILLSDSLCAILGLRRPRADDQKKQKDRFNKMAEEFKDDWGKDWDANWKHLQGIYDNKPKVLSNIKDILVEKFDPKVYSVLSYAKIENVEQRLLSIIKEIEEKQSDQTQKKPDQSHGADKAAVENPQTQQPNEKTGKKGKKFFKIVRLYWL